MAILLLLLAVGVKKDEEDRTVNRFKDWYDRVTKAGDRTVGRHIAVIQGIADESLKLIGTVFGAGKFSIRFVWASLMFSCMGFPLSLLLGLLLFPEERKGILFIYWRWMGVHIPVARAGSVGVLFWVETLADIFLLGVAALLPEYLKRYRWNRPVTLIPIAAALGIVFCESFFSAQLLYRVFSYRGSWYVDTFTPLVVLKAVAFGTVSDILFLLFIRWLLQRVRAAKRWGALLLGIVVVAPVGFLSLPLRLLRKSFWPGESRIYARRGLDGSAEFAQFALATNLVDVLVSLGLVLAVLTLILNVLTWQVLTRILDRFATTFPRGGMIGLAFVLLFFWSSGSFRETVMHVLQLPAQAPK